MFKLDVPVCRRRFCRPYL